MSENKTGKYLKYAVGEILLVVVGILIALQINNWNEFRKQSIEETNILWSLLKDLKQAEFKSIETIKREENRLRIYEDVLGLQNSLNAITNQKTKDSIFFGVLWSGIGREAPVINSYTDLKNSGRTNLISNEDIRVRFTSLENQIIKLNQTLDDRTSLQASTIDPVILNNVNFKRLFSGAVHQYNINPGDEIDYNLLLQSELILNLIMAKLDLTDSALRDRNLLYEEIKTLINLVENELN